MQSAPPARLTPTIVPPTPDCDNPDPAVSAVSAVQCAPRCVSCVLSHLSCVLCGVCRLLCGVCGVCCLSSVVCGVCSVSCVLSHLSCVLCGVGGVCCLICVVCCLICVVCSVVCVVCSVSCVLSHLSCVLGSVCRVHCDVCAVCCFIVRAVPLTPHSSAHGVQLPLSLHVPYPCVYHIPACALSCMCTILACALSLCIPRPFVYPIPVCILPLVTHVTNHMRMVDLCRGLQWPPSSICKWITQRRRSTRARCWRNGICPLLCPCAFALHLQQPSKGYLQWGCSLMCRVSSVCVTLPHCRVTGVCVWHCPSAGSTNCVCVCDTVPLRGKGGHQSTTITHWQLARSSMGYSLGRCMLSACSAMISFHMILPLLSRSRRASCLATTRCSRQTAMPPRHASPSTCVCASPSTCVCASPSIHACASPSTCVCASALRRT